MIAPVDTVQEKWLADTPWHWDLWKRFAPPQKSPPVIQITSTEPSWESATISGRSTLRNRVTLNCETSCASVYSGQARHVGALWVQAWGGSFLQHMLTTGMYPGEVSFLNHLQVKYCATIHNLYWSHFALISKLTASGFNNPKSCSSDPATPLPNERSVSLKFHPSISNEDNNVSKHI